MVRGLAGRRFYNCRVDFPPLLYCVDSPAHLGNLDIGQFCLGNTGYCPGPSESDGKPAGVF